ncbi:MAG TPA: nucleotidyltransferase family protein [Chloroflexaceae bacterium]|nr:nucleotidyltransferase family protein [Chloroflexaceae bacterium]
MIYGVLLAAGRSARMGQPKQLLTWRGRPLVRHAAETALASRLAGLVVVLGAEAPAVRAALAGMGGPVQTVECADYSAGQAASLRCGLAALPGSARAAVVLLVDQPLVGPELLDRLIDAFEADPAALAVVPRYQGRRGNPALLAAGLFDELRELAGDTGARALLERHAGRVRWLDWPDPAVLLDADTPEAYARLRDSDEGRGEHASPRPS